MTSAGKSGWKRGATLALLLVVGLVEVAFAALVVASCVHDMRDVPAAGTSPADLAWVRKLEWVESETAASLFQKDSAQGRRRYLAVCWQGLGSGCTVPGIGLHNAQLCDPEALVDRHVEIDDVGHGPKRAYLEKRARELVEQYNELSVRAAKTRDGWRCSSGQDWDAAIETLRAGLHALRLDQRHDASSSTLAPRGSPAAPELVATTPKENWPIAEPIGCAVIRRFNLPARTPFRLVDRHESSRPADHEERLVDCTPRE